MKSMSTWEITPIGPGSQIMMQNAISQRNSNTTIRDCFQLSHAFFHSMYCFSKEHGDDQGQHFPYVFMYSCTSPGLVHREDAQVLTAWVRNWAVPLKRAHHALRWPPRMGLQGAVGGVWGPQVGSSGLALFCCYWMYILLSPSTKRWFWWVKSLAGKCS